MKTEPFTDSVSQSLVHVCKRSYCGVLQDRVPSAHPGLLSDHVQDRAAERGRRRAERRRESTDDLRRRRLHQHQQDAQIDTPLAPRLCLKLRTLHMFLVQEHRVNSIRSSVHEVQREVTHLIQNVLVLFENLPFYNST